MSDISLHTESAGSVTCVSNTFIDHYMAGANGEYVKIYLYLLRCLSSNTKDFSITAIAQHLGHTDLDVKRALQYWEARNLLRLEYDWNQQLSGICLMDPITHGYSHATPVAAPMMPPAAMTVPAASAPPATMTVPTTSVSPTRAEDNVMKELFLLAEAYAHRVLSPQEMETIDYWNARLHFSPELIEFLINHCSAEGHTSIRYMDKVALSWAEQGISTLEEAEASLLTHSEAYHTVTRSFGITGRSLTPVELTYLDRWTKEYGFSKELLEEACNRSILRAPGSPFKYADRILSDWHAKGIRTKEEVEAQDLSFAQNRIAKQATWQAATPRPQQPKRDRFSNFKEREDFDWDAYELKLLQKK